MKYKKYSYIIVLILMLVVGINKTYAASENECHYVTSDNQTLLEYSKRDGDFTILKRGNMIVETSQNDPLINNGKGKNDSETNIYVRSITEESCPNYIVYRHKTNNFLWIDSDGVWGFDNENDAKTFLLESEKVNNMDAWLLSYKHANGTQITEEEFYSYLRNTTSTTGSNGANAMGEETNVDCDSLFGSKNDPESIRYLINEVLQYPKIIVPILIILLGMLDLGKAVIASKEDEMKKAQATFIKRVLIGIVVFFVPMIVDLLMYFADIVWEGLGYTTCGI